MKRILFAATLLVFIASGCGKDSPKFSSAEGTWTYTTPDGKIGVDFTLTNSGSSWTVTGPVIRVDGTTYNAEVQASGINPPAIGSIRINANDAKAVYAYNIVLTNGTVSSDFAEIKVPGATYTWPHDKTNSLTDVSVGRK